MKSAKADEIFGFASDEIKSTHSPSRRISPNEVGFHRRRRFHPPARVDLVKKDSDCDTIRVFFWRSGWDSPYAAFAGILSPRRPNLPIRFPAHPSVRKKHPPDAFSFARSSRVRIPNHSKRKAPPFGGAFLLTNNRNFHKRFAPMLFAPP